MPFSATFDLESPEWLRNLRWAAIAGMFLSVLGARFLNINFSCGGIFFLIGFLAVGNLLLPWIEGFFFASTKSFVFFQIIIDILVLTGVLWFSGGLSNPFAGFYVLHILIAGLLLSGNLTALVSGLACFCVIALINAPGILVGGQPYELRSSPIWYGVPIGIVLVILFSNGFILIFLRRMGRAQEQLRQKVKMDALGRLVAGLAHEIGTPLNSILVLSKDLEMSVSAEHRKELSTIASQAKRCGEIVSLLLGYSRTLIRRSEDIDYVPVQLGSWIKEIYSLLVETGSGVHPSAPDLVTFEVTVENIPEFIEVPTLVIRQVLENLFKNARDAVAHVSGPALRVHAKYDAAEQEVVISVSDNGPGFSPEVRERAFEAFYTTKKPGVGIGMGLYISYYLLTQVSGRIVIEEGQGPGAKISLTFPWPQERIFSQ